PLIRYIALLYAEKFAEKYGTYPSMDEIYRVFQIMVQAYLNNMLKLQDYSVLVYVCMGKVVTGIGNIEKCQVARVVESRPFEREDLALLKVEVKHAPSLVVTDEEAKIGERAWVLGYPGAVTFHELLSQTTTMIPTITSGVISGYREKITGLTVLQSDVAVTHGNSGGPMLNSRGEVIAVTSFGSADPTGSGREVPGFNFFIPSKYVIELMKRNGVENTQDPVMQLYEEGLRLYFNKHYSASIEKFQMVKDLSPGFPYVDEYIAEARAAILRGEDVPLEQGVGLRGIATPLAAVVGLGLALGLVMIKRRRSAGKRLVEEPRYQHLQMAGPHMQSADQESTRKVEAEPPAEAVTAVARMPQTIRVKYCWNCGRPIPVDITICPYCKAGQEVE
ncbi:MAG: trypsin-like peptidase domain-containing protein, partial [Desulfurococcales archaeon]|nr:trypsin-like peptidase domain-containing protein [Desulfurococcales archaeon]